MSSCSDPLPKPGQWMHWFIALAILMAPIRAIAAEPPDGPRSVTNIDDDWLFQWAQDETMTVDPAAWRTVSLPHSWNIDDGAQALKTYARGVGYYQKTLRIPDEWKGKSVFLSIGAANIKTIASLNGKHIVTHETGFTSFTAQLNQHLRDDPAQELLIMVDNKENKIRPPLVSDYTFFGGIHRSVSLIATEMLHISVRENGSSNVYVQTRSISKEHAEIAVDVNVANDAPHAFDDATLSIELIDHAHKVVSEEKASINIAPGSTKKIGLRLTVNQPRLWEGMADPYLYSVRARIRNGEKLMDEVIQEFGIRSFRVDPKTGFHLNGRPYPLFGPSLHQDRAGKGWGTSDSDRAEDVALLKELGATFVRLVHYPHSPRMLAILDKAGIIAWSEIPIAYRMGSAPDYENNARAMLEESIYQLYNHPSICFWGLYNEMSGIKPEPLAFIKGLNSLAKTIDPYRLTTGSAGAVEQDPICEVTDVVAFNRYFGWFIPGAHLMEAWAESSHELFPNRAIGLAEYGADGDVEKHGDWRTKQKPGLRIGLDSRMGTEEYQTQLHEELWLQIKDIQHLWCKTPWLLADWGTAGRKPPSPWPSDGMGRMGLVTYDRKIKKDAFFWYKANWSKEPVLHIAEKRFVNREYNELDLRIYSNLKVRPTILVNDEPYLNEPEAEGARLLWPRIKAKNGIITVEVRGVADGKEYSDKATWTMTNVNSPKPPPHPDDLRAKPVKNPGF